MLTNVNKKRTLIIKAHEKKLKNLSKNFRLLFTSDEVITNLSNYQLSDTERDLLKYFYHFWRAQSVFMYRTKKYWRYRDVESRVVTVS